MSRSRVLAWAACASLALLAGGAGCRPADDPGAPVGDATPGGIGIVSVTSDFQAFNPVTNTALVTLEVINYLLFTPLVQYDDDLNPQPWLAESWDLEDTGVTFRLRDDVRWHDGQPVTAEDVKFTFDLAKTEEAASLLGSAYLTMIRSATVVDPRTVRFDFVEPHSQPLEAFWWAPVPRHMLEGVAPAELAQAPFNRQPVGSGPFRFVSWEAGQALTLEANPDFPEALGGRPYLDRVVFRVVQEATTRLTELLTGAVDVNYSVLPDEARQVEGQRGVELTHFAGREFLYVGMNNERAPFDDPRVRLAVSHAIDRQGLIDAVLLGYGEPAAGMIPPWHPLNPGADAIPHDVEAARRLLAEAGWEDSNGDGLVDRGGQPLRFTLILSEDRTRQDLATVLQQQFRRAGMDVRPAGDGVPDHAPAAPRTRLPGRPLGVDARHLPGGSHAAVLLRRGAEAGIGQPRRLLQSRGGPPDAGGDGGRRDDGSRAAALGTDFTQDVPAATSRWRSWSWTESARRHRTAHPGTCRWTFAASS
jgi:peptide/nickel transport system substrate-binding protein